MRNIGSMGAVEGSPIVTGCPLRDALRSIYPWFALFGLLLLRRSNRNRRAWAILLPLLAVYGILRLAENGVEGPMSWYVGIYVRSFVYEALRALSLGLALLLSVADLIRTRSAFLRRVLSFAIVFSGGTTAILLNAPLAANSTIWVVVFAIIVLASALGLSILARLLHRLLGRSDLRWHAGVYLALGVGPILLIQGIKLLVCSHPSLLSTVQQIITTTIIFQVVFVPYLVYFCFAALALVNPLYRQRLAGCFAKEVSTPTDNPPRCASV